MTDYKSLDEATFTAEVVEKIALQLSDNVKISALYNDYEHKLENEDAAQDVLKASVETDMRTAEDYIRTIQIHKNYILNQMLALHNANPSDFTALHEYPIDLVLNLNPLVFLSSDPEKINGSGAVADQTVVTSVDDLAQTLLSL